MIIGHALWDAFAILTSASPAAQGYGLLITALIVVVGAVVAIVRWRRARRGPLLTLAIPRPRPQWQTAPHALPAARPHIPAGL